MHHDVEQVHFMFSESDNLTFLLGFHLFLSILSVFASYSSAF